MLRKSRVTLKDVAKAAGVNFTLVSKYINNSPQARMSEETRKRIQRAIKDLDYCPSASARTLRNGKSKTIGLLSGDLTNPYRAHWANLAMHELGERGYQLLIALNDASASHENISMQTLVGRDVDGIIFIGPGDPPASSKLHCPMILNDRYSQTHSEVNVDLRDSLDAAFENLSGKAAGLFFDNSVWKGEFELAGHRHGLDAESHFLPFDYDARQVALKNILKTRPEVILINGWHTTVMILELLTSDFRSYTPKIFCHANCTGEFYSDRRITGVIYSSGKSMVRETCSVLVEQIEASTRTPVKRQIPSKYLKAGSPEYISLISKRYRLT